MNPAKWLQTATSTTKLTHPILLNRSLRSAQKMRFVVMSSVFYTPLRIHRMFDLKGSSVGRAASEEDRLANKVMKENDMDKDNIVIRLGPKFQNTFCDVLKKDSEFLASHNIMDYR